MKSQDEGTEFQVNGISQKLKSYGDLYESMVRGGRKDDTMVARPRACGQDQCWCCYLQWHGTSRVYLCTLLINFHVINALFYREIFYKHIFNSFYIFEL